MSKIEWTEQTWNPTTGCDRVSPGCDHCYALTLAKRLKGMGSAKYQNDGNPRTSGPGFGVATHVDTIDEPLKWRKPRRVFVNSMSDLFHEEIPDSFIGSVFDVMARTPQHTYQILTKRHARMRSLLNRWADNDWMWRRHDGMWCGPINGPLPNVWGGVSVEDQKWADIRIPALVDTPLAVRFLSCEPLLGPVRLEFISEFEPACGGCSGIPSPAHLPSCGIEPGPHWGIDWVIIGGESGSGARPMDVAWARSLVQQCQAEKVAVFVKQLGAHFASSLSWSPDRKGGDPGYWPADLRVREYPEEA